MTFAFRGASRAFALALLAPCVLAFVGCNSAGSSGSGSSALASCHGASRVAGETAGPYLVSLEKAGAGRNGLRKLGNHIPRAVSRYSDQGTLAGDQEIPVTLALSLNHEAELDDAIAEMYRPGSPGYHRFLTPGDFLARYAPTESQVRQVQAFLSGQGLKLSSVSENRLLVHAQGTASALGAAFHTEMHQYRDAQGGAYFAPAYEPQVPVGLPVHSVHGLQNVTRFRPLAQALSAGATAHSGSGPSGGLSPSDIRTAYNVPSTESGAGETLAVLELDGYAASDVSAYESHFGLPSVPLQNILVDGATGSAGAGAGEVTLDIELMIALAPGARKVLVYEGPNNDQGILDTYSKMANDNLAREISISWGSSEDQISSSYAQAENSIFKQMAAQGQSVFAAAGDNGAYDNGSSPSVDDPGSQPFVVAVGGTRLTTGAGGAYVRETTWNADGKAADGAGGGGISTIWTQPSWQQGLATAANLSSTSMRNVPDVALDADPATGYAIYVNGGWSVYGGTSCAAPLWTAFAALVNERRSGAALSPLGLANPALYAIGRGSGYGSDFFDIADGSTNIKFPAVSGFDDATGWGSFNGQNLLQSLAGDPAPGPAAPSCSTGCCSAGPG